MRWGENESVALFLIYHMHEHESYFHRDFFLLQLLLLAFIPTNNETLPPSGAVKR